MLLMISVFRDSLFLYIHAFIFLVFLQCLEYVLFGSLCLLRYNLQAVQYFVQGFKVFVAIAGRGGGGLEYIALISQGTAGKV